MTRPAWLAALPWLVVAMLAALWEGLVRGLAIPPYILPSPSAVAKALVDDAGLLLPALGVTLRITLAGFVSAVLGGILLGVAITRSRVAEAAVSPVAVILQVMPLVAVAPILVIYAGPSATVYLSAFIVAFFPVLAATAAGLKAVEPAHGDLFRLYRARPSQRLALLEGPTAVPYVIAGVRTAAGLSLVGAVVAEFVAGTGGAGSGLAYRLVEASYRLNVPRLFAAAVLICLAGLAIHAGVAAACALVLRRWRPHSYK